MADNLVVRDADGTVQTIRTSDVGGVHTPHHRSVLFDAAGNALSRTPSTGAGASDPGLPALAVRRDAPVAAGADGQYTRLITDALGRLWARVATGTAHLAVAAGELFQIAGVREDDPTEAASGQARRFRATRRGAFPMAVDAKALNLVAGLQMRDTNSQTYTIAVGQMSAARSVQFLINSDDGYDQAVSVQIMLNASAGSRRVYFETGVFAAGGPRMMCVGDTGGAEAAGSLVIVRHVPLLSALPANAVLAIRVTPVAAPTTGSLSIDATLRF
jgi:hypothetical protein